MADVVFNLSADEGRFVSAMMNALNAQMKVKDEFKNIKKEAKDAEDQYVRMGKAAQDSADKAAQKQQEFNGKVEAAAATIGVALVAAATAADKALAQMYDHAAEKGKNLADQLQQLQGTLADFGQIDLMPDVLKGLKEVRSSSMSQEQIKGLYSQISRSDRDLSPEQRMQATLAAVSASDAGTGDVAGFGKTFAGLSKFDFTKGMDAKQLANLTSGLMAKGGLDEDMKRDIERAQGQGANVQTMQKVIELGIARRSGGESGKAAAELLKRAYENIRPEDIQTKFKEEKDPAAQAKIKGLEKEQETIESRQRQLQDRELAMARERDAAGKLKGKARTKALDALTAEGHDINEEQVGLGRRSGEIGREIAELQKQKIKVALPGTAEDEQKKDLYGLSPLGKLSAMLDGKGLPEDMKLSVGNLAKNMKAFDIAGITGSRADDINRKAGLFDTQKEQQEQLLAGSSEMQAADQLRRAQVARADKGQSVENVLAAARKEARETSRENAGFFETMANNAPGVQSLQNANDMRRAKEGSEIIVKQSRSLAGKDQENLRNGGNE
jgi:hypothetical protein